MEVVSQFYLALDEEYISPTTFEAFAMDSHLLSARLVAFSKSLGRKARISQPSTIDPRPTNER